MAQRKGSSGMGSAEGAGTSGRTREGTVPRCPVSLCPVGMAVTLVGEARPEVVEHLLKAGRELLLAATAFMNARAEAAGDAPRLERIEID